MVKKYIVDLSAQERAQLEQFTRTMRLLADQMVQLGYVEFVSHETVRQTLKKTENAHP